MTKISIDELKNLLRDPDTSPTRLKEHLSIANDQRAPFAPGLRPNPHNVNMLGAPRDAKLFGELMDLANWYSRTRRQRRFIRKINDPNYTGPVIVSEGDSWFQYPLFLRDTIDWLSKDYAILSLGAAGDTMADALKQDEILSALDQTNASILLLSLGGNDVFGNGALASYLYPFDPNLEPADYIKPSFVEKMNDVLDDFERIFDRVATHSPEVQIYVHGYDKPIPRRNGPWLGKPMRRRKIVERQLQKEIAAAIMKLFNDELAQRTTHYANVTYVETPGTVAEDQWHDELHPSDSGFELIAKKVSEAFAPTIPSPS